MIVRAQVALVIIVVSLTCTAYLCGSLIVFCQKHYYPSALNQAYFITLQPVNYFMN